MAAKDWTEDKNISILKWSSLDETGKKLLPIDKKGKEYCLCKVSTE